jgi:hypothetical protein
MNPVSDAQVALQSRARPLPWIGELTWRVLRADEWSEAAWFSPSTIRVSVVVGEHAVEIWLNGGLRGLVARAELRTWLACGTGPLPAGDGVRWTSRPMGIALEVADASLASPWPVPSEIASHLAGHL